MLFVSVLSLLITHGSYIAAGMGRAFRRVCLFVHALKGKRLQLSAPVGRYIVRGRTLACNDPEIKR